MKNIDLHTTHRQRNLRGIQDWHDRQEAEKRYRLRKEEGSPLPAILALAAVCAVAWLAGFLWGTK